MTRACAGDRQRLTARCCRTVRCEAGHDEPPLVGARENPATGRSFLREGPLPDEALGPLRQLRAGAARSKKLCAHVMASTATAAGLAEGNPAALGAGVP